jgi:hypothetical protein
MGEGYWVWLIPLGSGNTSVGIVTDEQIHPYSSYRSYELAMKWLEEHEPVLHAYLRDRKPMDFLGLRKYSHTSSQIFSHNRWACVGEAGVFADPFYSPGSDLIGFANTVTTEMIRLDSHGELTQDIVNEYNSFVIGLNNALTVNIQQGYPLFGQGIVSAAKLIWDNTAAWSFVTPQMFNSTYVDLDKHREIRRVTASFFGLTRKVQQLLIEWSKRSPGRLTFDFVDYLSIPYLYRLRRRNLRSGKPLTELIEDQKSNMQRVEELAQVLFMLAVEDVMPEHLEKLREAGWLNPWRMSLDPDRWEDDGLFAPRNAPRSLDDMYAQIRGLFRFDSPDDSAGLPARSQEQSEEQPAAEFA